MSDYGMHGGGCSCDGCDKLRNIKLPVPDTSAFFKRLDPTESVDHPQHYNQGKYEAIDVIEDWQLGFSLGNAVKYISRAGKKDPSKTIEDLEKAAWYVQREIKRLKGE